MAETAENGRKIEVISSNPRHTEDEDSQEESKRTFKYLRLGPRAFLRKFLWTPQNLTRASEGALLAINKSTPLRERLLLQHRRLLGLALPAIFFHFFWWAYMIKQNLWWLFPEKYFMSVTMVFGSLIAGMTSEGGGAVAFPVMTLGFGIPANVARDFSALIQAVGMSAASFTIFFMRIRLEYNALVFCSLGGLGGLIFGIHMIDPYLTPQYKKMGFVSIWFAFASVLAFLNHYRKRRTYSAIQNFNWWRLVVLLMVGFVGGIFTAFSGSGLDICSFSFLTLLFRVSERVATPTSVILMAFNSIMCIIWRNLVLQSDFLEPWQLMTVCVPIVVIGAPMGSILGSHFHRLVLAALVIVIDVIALVSAFIIVRPMTPTLIISSVGIIFFGFFVFGATAYVGQRLMATTEEFRASEKMKDGGEYSSVTVDNDDDDDDRHASKARQALELRDE